MGNRIKKLIKELKADKGYYYAWQANIAVAVQDSIETGYLSSERRHKQSNEAAKKFLDLLIYTGER